MPSVKRKKDARQNEIEAYLKSLGIFYMDSSTAHGGYPDMVVWHDGWHFLEVKANAKSKLTPHQVELHQRARDYGAIIHVVWSIEQVCDAIGLDAQF